MASLPNSFKENPIYVHIEKRQRSKKDRFSVRFRQCKWTSRFYPTGYRERLTMPKMLTSGTNDEFFLPDETPIWWDDMPGPMYMQ